MRRAVTAEWLRIRLDPAFLIMVVVALLLGASIALALPASVREAPGSVLNALRETLGASVLRNAVVLSALYGAFRITSDLDRGVIAWRGTLTRRTPLLVSKLMLVVPGGGAVAVVTVGSAGVAFSLATDQANVGGLGRAALAGALGSLWGFAVGVLVRRHLLALAVVAATLGAATLLDTGSAAVRSWLALTPLVSFTDVGSIEPAEPLWSVLRSVGWVAAATAAALIVFRRRDLL